MNSILEMFNIFNKTVDNNNEYTIEEIVEKLLVDFNELKIENNNMKKAINELQIENTNIKEKLKKNANELKIYQTNIKQDTHKIKNDIEIILKDKLEIQKINKYKLENIKNVCEVYVNLLNQIYIECTIPFTDYNNPSLSILYNLGKYDYNNNLKQFKLFHIIENNIPHGYVHFKNKENVNIINLLQNKSDIDKEIYFYLILILVASNIISKRLERMDFYKCTLLPINILEELTNNYNNIFIGENNKYNIFEYRCNKMLHNYLFNYNSNIILENSYSDLHCSQPHYNSIDIDKTNKIKEIINKYDVYNFL